MSEPTFTILALLLCLVIAAALLGIAAGLDDEPDGPTVIIHTDHTVHSF